MLEEISIAQVDSIAYKSILNTIEYYIDNVSILYIFI